MANYDSNYAIAQEISARIGNSPIPFDSVYSICMEIYHQLGGAETEFDSVYSILLAILPLTEGGGQGVQRLLRLIELMASTGISVETTSISSATVCVENDEECNVSAVIWGDGTYTETDGSSITSGDTESTTMVIGAQNLHCLTHTYASSVNRKIKVVGTKFNDTFDVDNGIIDNYIRTLFIEKGVQEIHALIYGQANIQHISFDEECTTIIGGYGLMSNSTLNNLYFPSGIVFNQSESMHVGQMKIKNFIWANGYTGTTIPKYFNYFPDGSARYGVDEISVPNSTVIIGKAAFGHQSPYWSGDAKSMVLPSGVTTINDFAFTYTFGNGAVIDLPATISSIGNMAFWRGFYYGENTEGVADYTVICRATTPPTCNVNAFYGVDSRKPTNCTLYVPNESLQLYANATGWSEFGTILPLESLTVPTATMAEIEQMFQ